MGEQFHRLGDRLRSKRVLLAAVDFGFKERDDGVRVAPRYECPDSALRSFQSAELGLIDRLSSARSRRMDRPAFIAEIRHNRLQPQGRYV